MIDGAEFQVSEPAFLVLQSDQPIWALAEFGGDLTRACLPAEDLYATGRALVLPHVAEGGGWRTQVVISNTDTNAAHLQARYYSETGVELASTTFDVLSKRILLTDVWALFAISQPTDLRTGWIELTGDTNRVHAGIIFSGEGDQVLSALPAQPTPRTDIYFSHVAQDDLYYTGIALVNDSGHPTNVTIEIWSAAGVLVNSATISGLGDRSKYIRLLSDPLLGVNQSARRLHPYPRESAAVRLLAVRHHRADAVRDPVPMRIPKENPRVRHSRKPQPPRAAPPETGSAGPAAAEAQTLSARPGSCARPAPPPRSSWRTNSSRSFPGKP